MSVSSLLADLRRTLVGGPDMPPAPLPSRPAWWRRGAPAALGALAFLLVLHAIDRGDNWGLGAQAVWVLASVPLALVIVRPLLAWRVAWVAGMLTLVVGEFTRSWRVHSSMPFSPTIAPQEWFPAQALVFLIVLFAVGMAQPAGVSRWVGGLTAPMAWWWLGGGLGAAVLMAVTLVGGMLGWGYLIQRRRLAQQRLARAEEHGTVLVERARIARELHDVVAHHMSLIAVRAETAPYRLEDLPEAARTELAEITGVAREAMAEMRQLLGVLRSDEPLPPTAPQPGLADLPALVESTRAAGVPVTLDTDATLPAIPAAADVSAYRIVQEALSNTVRHAPGASARVVVGRAASGLSVLVRNTAGHGSGVAGGGVGHGLQGMRERVAMLGGELTAGPTPGGGFEVSAVLPLSGRDT